MILGPNDPRAITGQELDDARAYTKRFNRDVLGLRPMTAAEKAEVDAKLDIVLALIDWEGVRTMKRDITDVTENGSRLYDFYDDQGHLVETRLTYGQAEFIYGSHRVEAWKHVPHVPPGQ